MKTISPSSLFIVCVTIITIIITSGGQLLDPKKMSFSENTTLRPAACAASISAAVVSPYGMRALNGEPDRFASAAAGGKPL